MKHVLLVALVVAAFAGSRGTASAQPSILRVYAAIPGNNPCGTGGTQPIYNLTGACFTVTTRPGTDFVFIKVSCTSLVAPYGGTTIYATTLYLTVKPDGTAASQTIYPTVLTSDIQPPPWTSVCTANLTNNHSRTLFTTTFLVTWIG